MRTAVEPLPPRAAKAPARVPAANRREVDGPVEGRLLAVLGQAEAERHELPSAPAASRRRAVERRPGHQHQVVGLGAPGERHLVARARDREPRAVGERAGRGDLLAVADAVPPVAAARSHGRANAFASAASAASSRAGGSCATPPRSSRRHQPTSTVPRSGRWRSIRSRSSPGRAVARTTASSFVLAVTFPFLPRGSGRHPARGPAARVVPAGSYPLAGPRELSSARDRPGSARSLRSSTRSVPPREGGDGGARPRGLILINAPSPGRPS